MKFKHVQQEVFKLEDIKTLVESLRVETNENIALCFDLEEHAQRLMKSIIELQFDFPKGVTEDEFIFFLLNQIKNKLQYHFNKQAAFTQSEYDKNLNKLRLSNEIFKLRIIYHKDGQFKIELDEYTRALDKEWQVKLLSKDEFHIESSNLIWQHKFLPRPDFSYFLNQGYDEVIWLDENEHVCEGSFTAIIFEENKSPLANTLPSVSLQIMSDIEKITCREENLRGVRLVNSLIGKVDCHCEAT